MQARQVLVKSPTQASRQGGVPFSLTFTLSAIGRRRPRTKPTTIPAWYHSLMVLNLGGLSTKKWEHRPHLGVSSNDAGSGDWENLADLRGRTVYQNKYNRSEPQQPGESPLATRIVGAEDGLTPRGRVSS